MGEVSAVQGLVKIHRGATPNFFTGQLRIQQGAGLSLIQDLHRENIYAFGIDPDGDKLLRMEAQTALIEAGAVHLPANAPWLDEFKKEVLSFPKGRHDDQVDALSQGLQRVALLRRPSAPVQSTWSGHRRE